jgi:energy-coupling factor transport system permease protein
LLVTWKYRPRDTIIQKLDPRARLIYLACVILALTLTQIWDLRYILPVTAISLAMYFLARIEWQDVRRAWIFIGFFIFFILGLNAFLSGRGGPMEILREASPAVLYRSPTWIVPLTGWKITITLTAARAWFGLTQMTRMLAMVALAISVPYTFDPNIYGVTFRRMGLPDKASFAVDLAFRFVPTLARDFGYTIDAQRARGFELERLRGGLLSRLRKLAPLLVPVTMLSIMGGEEVIDAMDLRAFGTHPRTWLRTSELHFATRDYLLIGLGLVLFLGYSAISLMGYGHFWVPEWFLALAKG